MKLLTSGLTDIGSFMNKSTRRDGVELIAKYFNQKQTKRGTYFLKFFACELLNFANVVGQIFFTDMFLGYQFQEFGRWNTFASHISVDVRTGCCPDVKHM